MAITDYFKPVLSMTAEEVREFLKEKDPADYNLIDVRQPAEYRKGHIPGAQLVPLGEIREHVNELAPEKPTIAY